MHLIMLIGKCIKYICIRLQANFMYKSTYIDVCVIEKIPHFSQSNPKFTHIRLCKDV